MEPLQPGDPERAGRYRLTHRLGAGGMGQVYLARTSAGRQVVVKVIRPEHASDVGYRQRFAREVEAARTVGGFHTALVVDADTDADPPWVATAYIPGLTLHQVLGEQGPLEAATVRVLAAGAADGLQAIHASGLVHRDLKAGNIIVADDGPRIIDFGIARPLDTTNMTTSGAVMGTLPYMSPEQAEGQRVGPASDVFSLGTVLAFAATGTNPFAASTLAATIRRIIGPAPELDGIPDDLAELITQCWSQAPEQRPTPERILARFEVADLDGVWPPTLRVEPDETPALPGFAPTTPEPVASTDEGTARASTTPARLAGSAESDPQPARTTQDTEDPNSTVRRPPTRDARRTSSASGAPTGQAPNGSLRQPKPGAPHAASGEQAGHPTTGSTGAVSSHRNPWYISLAVAIAFVLSVAVLGDWSGGTTEEYAQSDSTDDTSGPGEASPAMLSEHAGPVDSVVFAPDGATLATVGSHSPTRLWEVRVWEAESGEQITSFDHEYAVRSLAFSAEGVAVAAAIFQGTVRMWDVEAAEEVSAVEHDSSLESIGLSPDAATLATADFDDTVRLWEVESGEQIMSFDHDGSVETLMFDHDGTTLAIAGKRNQTVQLWDIESGEEVASFHHDSGNKIQAVAFSPDGTHLAAGNTNGTAWVWDIDADEETATLDHDNNTRRRSVDSVTFSPDGSTVATGHGHRWISQGDGGEVRLWDAESGEELATLDHDDEVESVAYFPDGQTLAIGSTSGIRLWDVP